MNFHVVNNEILVPVKCGTTYLESIFPGNFISIGSNLSINLYSRLYNLKGISAIIIKEPLEHLQSALHTELFRWYNLHPSEKLSAETATPLINNFITNESNPVGTTHWDINYYEHLYKFWKHNRNTLKVVHISELTDFIKQEYGIDMSHDKFSYGVPAFDTRFKYRYTTKQKLAKWIEETMPDLWNELVKDMGRANKFYNLLINKKIDLI